jgi:outer membrane protein OmpA-like peptidoglycan-associated protein
MTRKLLAFLFAASLPLSAASSQMHADPAPFNMVVAPYIPLPPKEDTPRPMRDYPRFHDDLIRIYFENGSTHLSPIAKRIVHIAAERAQGCGYQRITIAGHTDETRRSQAVALSRRMGEAVKRSLIARGMDPARISVEAYGFSRPAIAAAKGVPEPFNRRIEMAIVCPSGSA